MDKKRVPAPLLRAYISQEEQVQLVAAGKKRLPSRIKKEIKEEITRKLLKDTPPSLSGVEVVYDLRENLVYFGTHSVPSLDAFVSAFIGSFDLSPLLVDPAVTGEIKGFSKSKLKAIENLKAVRFSGSIGDDADVGDEVMMEEHFIGRDFLTWLWHQIDITDGNFEIDGVGRFGLMFDDQLTLSSELTVARENIIKQGAPIKSPEAIAALKSGKKISKAKLYLGIHEEEYLFTLDSKNLDLSGAKLPKFKAENPIEYFEERMTRLKTLHNVLDTLIVQFLEERISDNWTSHLKVIRSWIEKKEAR
jgi:hypothetical protein